MEGESKGGATDSTWHEEKEKGSSYGEDVVQLTNKQLLSRLLYPNPVCLLSVASPSAANVMTISWLTCVNNNVCLSFFPSLLLCCLLLIKLKEQGLIICIVNKRRFTSTFLQPGFSFVLNVPIKGMEKLVLSVGGSSGRNQNKFESLGIPTCRPGWLSLDPKEKPEEGKDKGEAAPQSLLAIAPCVAHIVCRISSRQEQEGHYVLFCHLLSAFVKADYWNGKTFIPQREDVPPYFTFLGSQQLALVSPTSAQK
ncbi:hypothetical protein QOT17_001921 [Balamuthia mandrillaris]